MILRGRKAAFWFLERETCHVCVKSLNLPVCRLWELGELMLFRHYILHADVVRGCGVIWSSSQQWGSHCSTVALEEDISEKSLRKDASSSSYQFTINQIIKTYIFIFFYCLDIGFPDIFKANPELSGLPASVFWVWGLKALCTMFNTHTHIYCRYFLQKPYMHAKNSLQFYHKKNLW